MLLLGSKARVRLATLSGTLGRALAFGRQALMARVLGRRLPDPRRTVRPSAPGMPAGAAAEIGANPDALAVLDQASGIVGRGTACCATCVHFVANRPCPKLAAWGKNVVLDQAGVRRMDNGGCAAHEWLPDLAVPGRPYDTSALCDRVVERAVDGGVMVVLKDGRVSELTAADLGLGDEDGGPGSGGGGTPPTGRPGPPAPKAPSMGGPPPQTGNRAETYARGLPQQTGHTGESYVSMPRPPGPGPAGEGPEDPWAAWG